MFQLLIDKKINQKGNDIYIHTIRLVIDFFSLLVTLLFSYFNFKKIAQKINNCLKKEIECNYDCYWLYESVVDKWKEFILLVNLLV